MSDARSGTAGKHFASLTSLLLTIFVVSTSGVLFRFDFSDYRAEVQALDTLEDFSRIDWSLDNLDTSKIVYGSLRTWIGSRNQAASAKLTASRTALLEALRRAGISTKEGALEGKFHTTGDIPFRLLQVIPLKDMAEWRGQRKADDIARVIGRLKWAASPTRIVFYELGPSIDIEAEGGEKLKQKPFTLLSATAGADVVTLSLLEDDIAAQGSLVHLVLELAATPSELTAKGPSIIALYFQESDEERRNAFEGLASDAAMLEQLRERYGLLPSREARTIASSSLIDGFKSISVLGFHISPRRLPPLIFGLNLLILLLLLGAVEIARAGGARPIEGASGNPVEICVNSAPIRWALWVVMPAASVNLADAGGGSSLALIGAASAMLVALGTLITLRAAPLLKNA